MVMPMPREVEEKFKQLFVDDGVEGLRATPLSAGPADGDDDISDGDEAGGDAGGDADEIDDSDEEVVDDVDDPDEGRDDEGPEREP